MTELSSPFLALADEVLADIVGRLDSFFWALIWTCGSKSLNRKLSVCLSRRTFHWKSIHQTSSIWPLYLHRFPSLTDISLEPVHENASAQITAAHFLMLPRTVRKLQIKLSTGSSLLQEAVSLYPSYFNCLEVALFHFSSSSVRDSRENRRWPSNLTSLQVPVLAPSVCLEIPLLPSNITTLTWHSPSAKINPGDRFPETLTKLHWSVPPGLPLNYIALLPKGLVDLSLSGFLEEKYLGRGSLPPGLTTLQVQDLSISALVECCPPHLTSLLRYLRYHWPENPVPDLFRGLPQSLTFIEEIIAYRVTPEIAAALPRSLTFMNESLSLSALPYLPDSMTSLDITLNDLDPEGDESDAFSEDDESIERILPEEDNNPEIVSKENPVFFLPITRFPSHLKVLFMNIWLDPQRYVPHLPLTLTELDALQPITTTALAGLLPRGLRKLVFRHTILRDRNKILRALPPSLHSLQLILRNPTSTHKEKQISALNLPRMLHTLDVLVSTIDVQWIAQLPISLTVLKITTTTFSETLSSELPMRFPDLLSTLEICLYHLVSTTVLSSLLRNLPPLLHTFWLRLGYPDSGLTIDDCRNLPRALEEFYIPNSSSIDAQGKEWLQHKFPRFHFSVPQRPHGM